MTSSRCLAPLPLLLIGLAVLAALALIPWIAQAQSRDSGSDFTLAAANGYPTGIWSDGTTMWVADFEDHKLYAYRMSDRSRVSGKDFTLDADNGSPVGIWSDGTTMWASDFTDAKLYAYRMSDRRRDSGKDFNTLSAAGNKFPEGIWSDGTTMWVADTGNDTVFAYDLSTRAWDFEKDITLGPGHDSPMGVWSNGSTMWVSDWRDAKLYAYRMSDQTRDSGKDFALDADDESYEGIWSAGSTMWVASRDDAKLYAYDWNNPATGAPTITGAVRVDETLAAGTRSIADADGLDAAIFEYQWVSNDGNADTDIAGATDSTYTIVPGDRDRTVKVRVSFSDGAGNEESLTSEPTGRIGAQGICDRTPAVMAAIVAGMTGVVECSEASETRLRTWTGSQHFGPDVTPGLYLQGRGLSALQAGDFRDLHALRALDLNRNFLETVPDGLFEDLRAVEEIDLSGNLLSELPDGLFDGQTANLSLLDLSANGLETLPEGMLRDLDALVSLSLSGNGISDLPAGLFDDLASLEVLDLSANSINDLPEGVFGGLGDLRSLFLAGNDLKSLPEDVFADLGSLGELDLSGNKLKNLPVGVFEGLSGLTDLDAGDNPGSPFTFTAELERRGDDTVVVRLAEGATPFDLQIELSARNGDLSADTVTIASGISYSDVVDVRAHGHLPVTIEIDSADFLLPSGGSASGIRADRGSAMLMWVGRPLVQREWIQDGPFALHPENADPKSIWSDGETLWVGDETARKVFAYKLWDDPGTEASEYGTRDPGWDLPSLGDEDFYVTGHGPRLYVAEESLDGASRDVFGYDLTSFTREKDRDFVYGGLNVAGGVFIVRGMATDGRHMWITNTTSHAHAFRLFDDPETPEDEYGRPDTSRKLTIPGSGQLRGLFTDGRTMWGVRFGSNDASARSVKLSDGTDAGYDFPLHEDNDHAHGIWSDGETFYVVDADDDMIYTYHGIGGVVRPFVEDAETAAALVGNTGQPGDAVHGLGSAGAKRAQAFTTGTSRAGYALASVGIEFGDVSDTSSAPSDLEATLNADSGGVPGDALCTLIAPASLSELSVNTFAAPASGTTCPVLEKETTYFVVVERVRVTGSGAIAVSGTASGSEDAGAAEGWSIADGSVTYSPQAAAQGWASDAFSYKIEVRGSFINNAADGGVTVMGTAQVDETLTADTSGITDDDGLTGATYSYWWLRIDGAAETKIGSGSPTYTLVAEDLGKRIKVRVEFVDDRGNHETLSSEATPSVKAADRPGTVSLFPARPRVGTVVSAALSDPDGLEGGGSGPAASLGAVSWSWAKSSDGTAWTRIEAYGKGDSYVPTEEDEGMLLKAEASYTDGHGSGKSAQAVSRARVGARESGPELKVTEIVTGLSHPWGIDFTPDGTMLFTQRAGVLNARLTDGTVKRVDADLSDLLVDGFAGLQALAVDPDFSTNRRFYTLQGHTGREMQVIAWTIDADYDEATRVVDPLVEGIPVGPGPWHSGGRLVFGPEGYLWIATGDGRVVTGAQDLTSLGGKVLRVDSRTGAGAPGNPFGASSPVYAYGFRNPQGLALRPGTDQMWLVEHGPKHDDEINLLAPGGNYGWDPIPDDGTLAFYDYSDEAGVPMTDLAKFPSARQARWSSGFPTLATSGAVFLDGPQWGEWEGRLAVATLKTKSLRVFEFTEQGDFAGQIVVPELDGSQGRLRTPVLGPDGALYIATSNKPGVDRILRVAANRAATGAPVISGTVEVGESLTADVSGITDPDGLDDDAFSFQWVRSHHGSSFSDIEGATASTYTLVMADLGKTISVRVSFYDDGDSLEALTSQRTVKVSVVACTVGEQAPAATAVEVQAVPAIVESTTEEYFVLYVRPALDSEREFPVSVTLGEDGTTMLTEQLSPLPKEHYRVEKFLITDPADIDNDCIDDITELGDPVGMNPMNPARAVPFRDGAVAIPDRETFEALSYKGRNVPYHPRLQDLEFVKFYIIGVATDDMGIYFMNTETHRIHPDFGDAIGLWDDPLWGQGYMGGEIIYHPNVVAPDGSLGVYLYQFQPMDVYPFGDVARSYEVLAASMALLDDNLAYYPMPRRALPLYHRERALYDDSRINVVLREDILPDVPFLPLNVGEGYGFLRLMSLEERPDPRDVVIYETIPNELSRVAGLITTVPQTPLSHVNLRAVQDGVPNAFIRDALDDGDIDDLIGRYVHYSVTADGYSIRAASPAEVEAFFAASRPPGTQTPERDLTVTQITDLDDIGFDDWNAFGVKAANVAVLRTLGFPDGTVPDGFAVPFYFYDEFMKHNGFYDDIEEMLEDPEFQLDYDTQEKELKKLRKKIKKGETPDWIIDALEEMHATYPEGQSLRYRSSTNNEDLPGFSGAGLYDSKTQDPEETEEDGIDKSIKGVWASLWNFRAFTEREFHRIDHMETAMGVLVHPNYSDELANGVAVSFDPIYGTEGTYYVNTQLGEDLVTNPDAHSVPEEILLDLSGSYTTLVTSNQVAGGQLLMSDAQIGQLRRHLQDIHDHFEGLYNPEPDEPFAMEIEFKITSDDVLSIKQARPWVFGVPNTQAMEKPIWSATLTVGVGEKFAGYRTFLSSPETNTIGALSPDTITLDDASYTVRTLGVLEGKLILSVMPRPAAGFVLGVGADEFASADATTQETNSLIQFQWNDPGLDWSEEEEVAVRLTEPADNNPATGAPTITGTPQVDQTLTADTSAIADEDGLTNVSYSYQWVRSDSGADTDIAGETNSTYTLVRADEGKTIKVRVSFTDEADNEETLTSAATMAVVARPNTPATGLPTISGTAQVDETLTADTSGIADEDGLDKATFSYQWIGSDGNNDTDISGQTGSTYTLVSADKGKTIKVRVSFTDDADNEETLTSAATTAVVARPNTPATGLPTISGTAQVDETLTADTSGIADEDGLDKATFSYQWIGSDGNNDTDISGQTGSTYTLVSADKGKTIKVRVSFTDDADNEETLTSAATTAVVARPNTPATGLPTISGTAQVDETLTADTSGIADEDGLDKATFSYQWTRSDGNNDTDISGQTGSTYTLVSADKGKTIKVRVSFTDNADNQETLTSTATAVVAPQPGSMVADEDPPVWSADMLVVEYTNVSIGAADADLFSNVGGSGGLQVQSLWSFIPDLDLRLAFTEGVPNAEDMTLQVGDLALAFPAGSSGQSSFKWEDVDVGWEDGQTISVRIVWTTATVTVPPNTPATGLPTISGMAQVDETLTADTSGIADEDGLDNATFSYQWIRSDGNNDTDIGGQTGSTYTLVSADKGKAIKVRVSFTDAADNQETLTSAATTAVASRPNTPATGLPTISGMAQVDETLTADTSGIADEDGLDNATFSYQWIRSDGNNDSDIPDATDTTYTLVSADEGKTIKVRVSFTDDADNEETLTSAATEVVQQGINAWSATMTVETRDGFTGYSFWGDPHLGSLSATEVEWDGKTHYVRFLFLKDGELRLGLNEEMFSTGFVLSVGDEEFGSADAMVDKGGASYRFRWDDPGLGWSDGNEVSVNLVQSDQNTPALRPPTISGTVQVDETLTADTTGVEDADGLTNVSYSYQWMADGVDIQNATSSTYKLVFPDQGKSIKVKVSFSDDADHEETLTSNPTRSVTAAPNRDATGAPTITGMPQVGQTLTADTSNIADQDGLTNASYSYQWIAGGSDIDGATGSSYELMSSEQGQTIQVRVTFTDDRDNAETLTSAATVAVVAAPNREATGLPTISGTPQVGETLTADISNIADEDGLDNVSYGYQWIRSDGDTDTEIAGQTSSTYTVAGDDVGKHVKVRVAFIDDAGNEESLTSGTTEVLLDYDADDDGLIEVTTLKQLDAIRHDLDGDGIPTDDGVAAYTAAFPGPVEQMGCSGADGCAGYEIMADLDFDTNGSDDDDDGDTYWNDGAGWTPIGGGGSEISTTGRTMHNPFLAIFEGNGRTISNLFVDKRGNFLGLFGYVGFDAASGAVGVIRNVNLIDVNVTGNHYGSGLAAVNLGVITNSQVTGLVTGVNIVGGLVGENYGVIAGSHVAGCVSGGELVGGLVGRSYGAITNSSVTGCVSALSYVGGLVGNNYGLITGSHTAGRVSGHGVVIGGLVGSHKGAITASRSTARVLGTDSGPQSTIIGGLVGDNRGAIAASYATGHVSGEGWVGGLVGQSASAAESPSAITASYATGRVSGTRKIGGLVGVNDGAITASYAAGPVSGSEDVGGLAGTSGGAITASYWDTRTSGHPAGSHGVGKTTAELQTPTGYSGIYETWNLNGDDVPGSPWDLGSATQHLALAAGLEMDTDDVLESLWDLGSASQYPALAADLDGAGGATWQEFGHQLRAGPVLTTTVTPGEDSVELSWTAVDTSHWSPVPTVTYTLYRGDGDTVEAIVRDLEGLIHTDDDVTSGETYSYQVVAVVAGGEAAHSALNSETPGVNAPATGAPTISGTGQVDETLTADTSGIADEDGLTNVSYSYQWIRNDGNSDSDIPDATDTTYTLVSADEGKTIKVRATFTDDADNEETLTSAATEVVQQGSNAWSATMTVETRDGFTGYSFWGDPHLGSLSATEVEWDGKTHYVRFLFLKDGELRLGLNEEMFSTGFVLSVGDEEFGSADAMVDKGGASYRFRWDDPGLGWSDGNEVSVNLVQSDQNTPALRPPTISGTVQVDETLTADTTGVEDADGLTNVSYSYQWIAGGTDIDGATGFSYELTSSEQGQTIQVRVTFTDDRDNAETLASEATVAVVAAPNREATGLPAISGTPQVGETLIASSSSVVDGDGLNNVSYRYQWIAGGTDIDGATGSSYELTSSEQGQPIQVRVTFTDDAGNAESLTSAATALVEARPNTPATGLPTISGTPQVDETLTADTSGISDNDGLTSVSYSYQWIAGGLDIAGATGSSYTLTSNEQGNTVRFE